MPRIFCITILLAMAAALMPSAMAQYSSENPAPEEKANVVELIQSESNGNVTLDIPDYIIEQIIREDRETPKNEGPVLKPGINKLQGYRIQVFSDGRNQTTLESRARARGNAIVAMFPEYRGQVYSFSSSPNWYTRIGNFQTQAEAQSALAELKKAFPQFASEMRVVKSQIVIIK